MFTPVIQATALKPSPGRCANCLCRGTSTSMPLFSCSAALAFRCKQRVDLIADAACLTAKIKQHQRQTTELSG